MNSKQLLDEQRKGAVILHNGAEVEYSPRRPGDRQPWVYQEGAHRYRYTAAQCTAYHGDDLEGP